jgi:hypothetical protein
MPNRIETTIEAVNGGFPYILLTGKSDIFPFDNGKRTSNVPTGTRLNGCMQGNKLTPITIKVEGADPLPDVTDEQISELCKQRKYLYIKPADCVVLLYTMNGSLGISANAKSVAIFDADKSSTNNK